MNTTAGDPRRTERALFLYGPLFALTAFVLVELLLPGTSAAYAGWPLVISLFLVGMPHGAIDLAIIGHITKSASLREYIIGFAGYVAVMMLSLAVFLLVPGLALSLFVFISAIHFGLADARDLEKRQVRSSPRWLALMSAVTRGSLLLALPFLVAPNESITVFADIVTIAGRSMDTVDTSTAQMVAGVAVIAAVLTQVAATYVRLLFKQVMVAGLELWETLVVSMALFVLHPLFAMGLYVLAWHSWRHIHSLTQVLPSAKTDGSWKQLWTAILSIHIQALPLLIPTVMIFGVIAWFRLEVWSSELLGALTIAFFAVVTLPHHLLVERLSRRPQQFSQQMHVVPLGAKTAAPSVALPIRTIDIRCHNSK